MFRVDVGNWGVKSPLDLEILSKKVCFLSAPPGKKFLVLPPGKNPSYADVCSILVLAVVFLALTHWFSAAPPATRMFARKTLFHRKSFSGWQQWWSCLEIPCWAPRLWRMEGLSMGMSFLWESHGKRPMGWDGTSHICVSHEIQK